MAGVSENRESADRQMGKQRGNKKRDSQMPRGQNTGQTNATRRMSKGQKMGLASALRKVRQPEPTLAQLLRAARAKLRHVDLSESMDSTNKHESTGRKGAKNAEAKAALEKQNEGSVSVSWAIHDDFLGCSDEGMDPLLDLRSVQLVLESTVHGCQVTVDLNGKPSVIPPAVKKGACSSREQRFAIAPCIGNRAIPALSDSTGSPDVKDGDEDEEEEQGEDGIDEVPAAGTGGTTDMGSFAKWGDSKSENATGSSGTSEKQDTDADSRAWTGSAAFTARVTIHSCEVQAKTTQELLEPSIEIVEVFENAVVVRMTNLTGDRFELTVYASGINGDSMGSAATFVQGGPVRNPESVHRIGQLESSQVYVAWVRVFCDSQNLDSEQKGFKTLPARILTIWDEADHIILGVLQDATTKEITKAFRQKSLQCHPDKETDPEKKDAAEEMMKRLNVAKHNMLRTALNDNSPCAARSDSCAPKSNKEGRGGFGPQSDSSSDGSVSSDDIWPHPSHDATSSPKNKCSWAPEPPCADMSLKCSLKIEAPRPPRLRLVNRGHTALELEATRVPIGCVVEIQKFCQGTWETASEPQKSTGSCMHFHLTELQENLQYRLRLQTIVEPEPLRFLFAHFIEEETQQNVQSGSPSANRSKQATPDNSVDSEDEADEFRPGATRSAAHVPGWHGKGSSADHQNEAPSDVDVTWESDSATSPIGGD